MINNVTLVGRLTKEVDLRFTQNGKAVANGTLAVNRPFKNANGETEADFINIVIWGKPAENTANYTNKGSLIGVTGRIQTRNYENNEGKRVYVTEVVANSVQFLDTKKKEESQQQQTRYTHDPSDPFKDAPQTDINDSDLPF
jgi:single-strand DNA-binding protein